MHTESCAHAAVHGGCPPPLNRAALAHLRADKTLSPAAWHEALRYCGFEPDSGDWRAYVIRMLTLGGVLFLLGGVIFFIAANWDGMHRFSRLGLMAFLVLALGCAAVWRGLDAFSGRTLLLACGIAMGPALAVFGQTYQTGAQLWELFRVWTLVLFLLALAGQQAGLWFAAWISGNLFVMLWLGRSMGSPLEAVGMFSTLPEAVLALFLAVATWEWAAWKFRDDERHAWLHSRWMPRLLFFDLAVRLTAYLVLEVLGGLRYSSFDAAFASLFLPRWPLLPALAIGAALLSWRWHRKITPDLFMSACILAGGGAVLVAIMLRAELFFDSGITGFFAWGLIIVGLTAGIGKILMILQAEKERRGRRDAFIAVPFFRAAFGKKKRTSWDALWRHLQLHGLLAESVPLPDAPPPSPPWYVRALLAFGGWVAAVLFLVFLGLALFTTLRIRSNEGATLFLTSLPVLAVAWPAVRGRGILARQFGFALALASAGAGGAGIVIMLDGAPVSCFFLAGYAVVLLAVIRSGAFRFLAAMAVTCLVPLGIVMTGMDIFGSWRNGDGIPLAVRWILEGTVLWWGSVAAAFAVVWLREGEWRASSAASVLESASYGGYAGMMCCLILALSSIFFNARFIPIAPGAVGAGAVLGVGVFFWLRLGRNASGGARAALPGAAAAALVCGWHLPGAALAVFGLALGEYMGNAVMRGATAAFLFMYMVYYYYLNLSLMVKSLFLILTGMVFLAVALAAWRFWDRLARAFPEKPAVSPLMPEGTGGGHA